MTRPLSLRAHRGFSLLELLVAIALLMTIMAAAVLISTQLMRTNNNVTNNVDMVQQGRQFMDQISSDLHMAGFPSYRLFNESGSGTSSSSYAGSATTQSGLLTATSTSMSFEGDVDNSGNVSVVYLELCNSSSTATTCTAPSSTTACPCTLRRGTVYKSVGGTPAYYTELSGVMNITPFIFTDYDGNQLSIPASPITNVRGVRVELQVQSTHKDIASGNYSVVTLDSETRLANY
ncbi:MAG TPA: prepilin-type N-terminal cleavage/methylation domain-containing protein [Candidatus Koribacter sp.]|jgi:type II secretory pathway pseudopilin PulG